MKDVVDAASVRIAAKASRFASGHLCTQAFAAETTASSSYMTSTTYGRHGSGNPAEVLCQPRIAAVSKPPAADKGFALDTPNVGDLVADDAEIHCADAHTKAADPF